MKKKSIPILLAFVVILSIVLAWKIWNATPAYETITSDVAEKVSIGQNESGRALYKPNFIVYQKNDSFWKVNSQKTADIDALVKSQLFNNLHQSDTLSKKALIDAENLPNSLRIKYHVAIPYVVYQQMTNHLDTSNIDEDDTFDEIIFSFDKKKGNVSFINSQTRTLVVADVTSEALRKLNERYQAKETRAILPIVLKRFTFNSSSEPIVLAKKTYVAEALSIAKFQQALLNKADPAMISNNDKVREYINGSVLLRYDLVNGMLLYVNPAQEITETKKAQADKAHVINESISYINSHSGFTGDFIIDDYDDTKAEVSYRLSINNIPVYSDFGGSLIKTTSGSSNIYRYQRPMFELSTGIPSEDVKMTLKSPTEALENLRDKLGTLDNVNGLNVVYVMKRSGAEASLVTLEPHWVYYVNGNYEILE
ncbi:YycH family regulatory protein [Brochothrix campestris]|uniref:Regulatory protein YycH domain-containing protein n=1 Tax=Brochothrix campestris FSL F6-1037 TaxID=1265861 RepID=W7CEK3_9LIST|nr:two-component system activity regulator YycH [Brochothrix campestris]EUJ37749.1 hypothetical protein BCAMP_09590 [Brochothrix campestris FSL F6-1037]